MRERPELSALVPRGGWGRHRVGTLTWLLLGVFASLAGVPAAYTEDAPPASLPGLEARTVTPRVVIDWHDGQLSVSAREAPWVEVLPALVRQTGITIMAWEALPGTLTQAFEALPLEQGLRRLFREMNTVFFYAPGPSVGAVAAPLTEVWLVPRERRGGMAAPIPWGLCRHRATGGA